MSDKYADAFAFLEHMGKTLEDDATKAAEHLRMQYDPRETTLALRYGRIGSDIRKMAHLLHEAFRYEMQRTDLAGRGASLDRGRGDPATRPDRPPVSGSGNDSVPSVPRQTIHTLSPAEAPIKPASSSQETAPECTCLSYTGINENWRPFTHDTNCPQHGRGKETKT